MQQAYTNALYSNLSPIWTKMAGITVRGPLFNGSWTDDQSLIQRQRRFRVKPSLTRDLIWTALVQQKLQLNLGQGRIWTWFKVDRRWWNAPLGTHTSTQLSALHCQLHQCSIRGVRWMLESIREIHGHVNKQLTNDSLETERKSAENRDGFYLAI